jgi:hypothetical protein
MYYSWYSPKLAFYNLENSIMFGLKKVFYLSNTFIFYFNNLYIGSSWSTLILPSYYSSITNLRIDI